MNQTIQLPFPAKIIENKGINYIPLSNPLTINVHVPIKKEIILPSIDSDSRLIIKRRINSCPLFTTYTFSQNGLKSSFVFLDDYKLKYIKNPNLTFLTNKEKNNKPNEKNNFLKKIEDKIKEADLRIQKNQNLISFYPNFVLSNDLKKSKNLETINENNESHQTTQRNVQKKIIFNEKISPLSKKNEKESPINIKKNNIVLENNNFSQYKYIDKVTESVQIEIKKNTNHNKCIQNSFYKNKSKESIEKDLKIKEDEIKEKLMFFQKKESSPSRKLFKTSSPLKNLITIPKNLRVSNFLNNFDKKDKQNETKISNQLKSPLNLTPKKTIQKNKQNTVNINDLPIETEDKFKTVLNYNQNLNNTYQKKDFKNNYYETPETTSKSKIKKNELESLYNFEIKSKEYTPFKSLKKEEENKIKISSTKTQFEDVDNIYPNKHYYCPYVKINKNYKESEEIYIKNKDYNYDEKKQKIIKNIEKDIRESINTKKNIYDIVLKHIIK